MILVREKAKADTDRKSCHEIDLLSILATFITVLFSINSVVMLYYFNRLNK